ncbi:MAG TPA: hypothetical protein VG365_13565 [Solirubrobacteraceae bacterium]|nr:hypothetical protein [Solirubrobacteraceae bacterium]
MSRARAAAAVTWDFVVGDDWPTALGVVVALAVTALAAGAGVSAWWILPVAIAGLLGLSIWRVIRR